MRRSKKFIAMAVFTALPIILLMLVGGGCTQAGNSESSQTETESATNERPNRTQPQMPLDEVAKILGIEQQVLENAFIQASNEIGEGGFLAPPGEWAPNGTPPDGSPPDGIPPDGSPPDGLPRDMEPTAPEALPEALLSRMAEILNIDQQTLEDAFAQAWSTNSAQ